MLESFSYPIAPADRYTAGVELEPNGCDRTTFWAGDIDPLIDRFIPPSETVMIKHFPVGEDGAPALCVAKCGDVVCAAWANEGYEYKRFRGMPDTHRNPLGIIRDRVDAEEHAVTLARRLVAFRASDGCEALFRSNPAGHLMRRLMTDSVELEYERHTRDLKEVLSSRGEDYEDVFK